MGCCVFFGRNARGRLEYAVKVKGAQADMLCQFIQGDSFRAFDQPAGGGDLRRMLFARCCLVRLAAFTGTEARSFGVFAGRVKLDILRMGKTRRACGPAVYASRSHGVEERDWRVRIASQNREPTGIVFCVGREVNVVWCGAHLKYEATRSSGAQHSGSCFHFFTASGRNTEIQ